MNTKRTIKEILNGNYEKFFCYCLDADKRFADELKPEDFVAYRAEYSVSREEIEEIKNLIYASTSKNFDASKTILKNYLKIEDFEPYKNIPLESLNFSNRAKNQLKINNFYTLGELLSCSVEDLFAIKKLGQGSLDNIFATLKKFFDSRKTKNKIARQNIDEFLLQAVSKGDPYVDVIIDSLEKFSVPIMKKIFLRDDIPKKIFTLPEKIKNKKLLPFVRAYNLSGGNLSENISSDLFVRDFPKYLENNFEVFEIEEIRNFIRRLKFDVNSAVRKIFSGIFKNEREFIIFHERSIGKTLQEIGSKFGVTRQRVRQIESGIVKKFLDRHLNEWEKIFVFLYALNGGENILTLNDTKNFLEEKFAEIIWYLTDKKNFSTKIFHYDKKLDALVFAQNSSIKILNVADFINSLPDTMTENIFEETIKNFAEEKNYPEEILRKKILKVYQRNGKIFHKGRMTLNLKFGYILKERFPNGYKIADETNCLKFNRCLKEIFDEQENFTQRNIDAKIGIIGVLCDRGKYIHRDFVHVPNKIIELINNFVEDSDRNVLPFKEIFEALKDKFIDTQITNHYFLQGVIKLFGTPYTLRRDYLTKDDEMNVAAEFDNFIKNHGEVSVEEIKSEFISFNDANINLLTPQCPEIIRIGEGVFLHSSQLNLTEKDFDEIEKFLCQVCENFPISSRNLFNLLSEKFSDFISRNEIYRHEKLFGILRYMFKDKFYFSRPYISAKEIKNISNKKVLLMYLEEIDKVEIEDLFSICEEHKIHYVAVSYLTESLRPEFIRVDEFSLMRPKSLGITDEIISAVCNELKSAMNRNGGWQSAKTFSDYEWLPQLEISWNGFLLESIVYLSEEKFHVIKNYSTDTNFSNAIFVSKDFAEDNFESFVLKVLHAEHEKQPFQNQEEIFDRLNSQGFCNKKLPKFLTDGEHISFDEDGKLILR